jgi:ParB-like chromosome segregation protein Spo0J
MTTKPTIQRMKIADLIPHEKNPRKITPAAMGRLKKSIYELGNLSPVTVNLTTGKVLGGHQRLKALAQLGEIETDVWCVNLDAGQETKALLTLNRSAGEWDEAALEDVLRDLKKEAGGLDVAGFTEADLDALCSNIAEPVKNHQSARAVAYEKQDDHETKLVPVDVVPMPTMGWALIGVPLENFSTVQALLDQLPKDAHVHTTTNSMYADE